MRLVFVLSGLGAGGAEKIVNLLAHHRLERGDCVHVIAVSTALSASYFPYDGSIRIHALAAKATTRFGLQLARARELRRCLQRIQPDVIISFLSKINVLTGLAATGLGTPVILSERNNYQVQRMNGLWRLLAPIAARRASCLVMQTEAARQLLSPPLRARAIVIPNPVSVADGSLSPSCAAPVGAPSFVAVGRLAKQKGFDLLLSAFSGVARDVADATLVIYGEGPERPALEEQVRDLGIVDRVLMPGVTGTPGGWLSPHDIFVLSSRFEGFPNVLLEALAVGMPAIAFDCPWGPSEILDDSGLLVPAEDVERLAAAMLRVARDLSLRKELSACGPAIAARYSKAAVFAKWDAAISKSLSGALPHPAAFA